ncbi:hypothetical protein OIU19_03180 [Pseudomonas sp. BT-42-2]|uniref:hypothetical protein n=1 Tax=Pseudomonas sp. BT-42-2 TaxID=2986927 RepID=UPI0021F6D2B8|nr:hypothetical protein [Pseudomonas sp. BT-42-2]MCV9917784.1 hypothetical protein [Pseudomonas sp. BT-42-2]
MRKPREFIWVVVMVSALLASHWFAAGMGKSFALVCVRIVGEQRSLEAALEECK